MDFAIIMFHKHHAQMSIATKTGDGGETSLLSGERVKKSDPRIHFVGSLDELNSHIGLLRLYGADTIVKNEILEQVQKDLFALGAGKEPPAGQLHKLETQLKILEAQLPPIRQFILPGGSLLACQAHVARAVCRRAERLSPAPSPYLNRLSDFLFLLARKADLASKT